LNNEILWHVFNNVTGWTKISTNEMEWNLQQLGSNTVSHLTISHLTISHLTIQHVWFFSRKRTDRVKKKKQVMFHNTRGLVPVSAIPMEFFDEKVREFECPVCQEVPVVPFQIGCRGGHIFCHACVQRLSCCAMCKDPILFRFPDRRLQRDIGQLPLKCSCRWSGLVRDWISHMCPHSANVAALPPLPRPAPPPRPQVIPQQSSVLSGLWHGLKQTVTQFANDAAMRQVATCVVLSVLAQGRPDPISPSVAKHTDSKTL
jgi:hypothetical protein